MDGFKLCMFKLEILISTSKNTKLLIVGKEKTRFEQLLIWYFVSDRFKLCFGTQFSQIN